MKNDKLYPCCDTWNVYFIFCELWKDRLFFYRRHVINRSSSAFDGEGIVMHLTLCLVYIFIRGDLTQNTTATATSPNNRFEEENNSCARAL